MKKNILLTIALTLGALSAPAQVKLKLSDIRALSELSGPATRGENPGKVDMILNISSPEVLDEVLRNGGEIVSEITSGSAIVSVDPAKAGSIAGLKGVTAASAPRLMKLTNNTARQFSNVDDVLAGTGLNSAYDGTGVVVGLFDVGLDPNHINFRDFRDKQYWETADSRVKMWLSYTGASSTPKIADTPETIATITTDSKSESHGTHTAGTMTGAFKIEWSDGAKFHGVAPGAEIIMAGGPGYNTQILDAVQRIAKYAKEVGKPCVINLSFGDNIGPHDGTDAFTKAINDVAVEYDAVICLSAGNERTDKIAIIKELTEEKSVLATIALNGSEKPASYATNYYQTSGAIEIYANDDRPFEVTLDIINNKEHEKVLYSFALPEDEIAFTETKGFTKSALNYFGMGGDVSGYKITSDDADFKEYYESGTMGGSRGISEENGRYMADIFMFLNSQQHTLSNTFVRVTVKGHPGQKIFLYTDGQYMNVGYRNRPSAWDGPDGNGTNSNMACGTETICVGSYLSANVSGSGYPTGTVGDVSYFSSYGETPDGRIMPDICAPGQVIISSRNSYLPTNNYYYPIRYIYKVTDETTNIAKEYSWTTCAGTSMSSPHMAGIAALWRQADPTLTYKDIQEIARTTAVTPEFTSKGWGYGKVDALAGIKKILSASSVYDIMESAPESIMIENAGGNVYDIFAPAEKSVNASVVNLQGVRMMERSAEGESLSLDLSGLNSGIYILNVTTAHSSRTLKIRR